MNRLKLRPWIYSLMCRLFIHNFLEIVKEKICANPNESPYNINYPSGNSFDARKIYEEKNCLSLREETGELSISLLTYEELTSKLYLLADIVINWISPTNKKENRH